jgi:hypothetical protein
MLAGTVKIIAPRANLTNLPRSEWWTELKVEGQGEATACNLRM